jgi:hypothetical protein
MFIPALAAALPGIALAGSKTAAETALPGVQTPKPKVALLPQGEPLSDPDRGGWVRMGDWDVKISGSVRLDVGAGDLPRRERR